MVGLQWGDDASHAQSERFSFLLATGELKGNASLFLGWARVSLVHRSDRLAQENLSVLERNFNGMFYKSLNHA